MLDVTLKVRLTLAGPILTRSTAIGRMGVDAPMARLYGRQDGGFFLPYSLVRGQLSQSWNELDNLTGGQFAQDIDEMSGDDNGLLGKSTDDSGNLEAKNLSPARGWLDFTDFEHQPGPISSKEQKELDNPALGYRIRMDSGRGASAKGAMQEIERPFAAGEQVVFEGEIGYFAKDEPQAESIKLAIVQGLRWTASFGAERTSGFGKLLDVEVSEISESSTLLDQAPALNGSEAQKQLIGIAITPQTPFCVAKRRVVDNLFESEIVLSGAVLKGVLAATIKRLLGWSGEIIDGSLPAPWQELGANFDLIRFTHAFPANKNTGKRPVRQPLSLVKDTNSHEDASGNSYDVVYDVAICESPGLIRGPEHTDSNPQLRAPNFSIDWKSDDDVLETFGWDTLDRELRVRTAIDPNTRRAKNQQLFAYEMVIPDSRRWLGYVDLSKVHSNARPAVEAQLRTILGYSLRGLGKTKARAKIDWDVNFQPVFESNWEPLIPSGQWVVTLQTSALLCNPLDLDETSGEPELFTNYQQVWDDLSGGSLKLVRFFAAQSLAGGYLVRRFRPGIPYNPFLLTDAGSVFVLKANGDAGTAEAIVKKWGETGLALPKWAADFYGDDWRTCPFLPVNGFGEVAVNLPCHQDNMPPGDLWHPI